MAETMGDLSEVKRVLALLSLGAGQFVEDIAEILKISVETIRLSIHKFFTGGAKGLQSKSRPGRPSKLTKTQRKQLSSWITLGPEKMGFPGACWRTPMIRELIFQKYGVYYSARYLSELLKNLGFSYQKATFVGDKQNEKARKKWIKKQWPEILALANKKDAHIFLAMSHLFRSGVA